MLILTQKHIADFLKCKNVKINIFLYKKCNTLNAICFSVKINILFLTVY